MNAELFVSLIERLIDTKIERLQIAGKDNAGELSDNDARVALIRSELSSLLSKTPLGISH